MRTCISLAKTPIAIAFWELRGRMLNPTIAVVNSSLDMQIGF